MISKGNIQTAKGNLNFNHRSVFIPENTAIPIATNNCIARPAYFQSCESVLLLIDCKCHLFLFEFHYAGAHFTLAIKTSRFLYKQFGGSNISVDERFSL